MTKAALIIDPPIGPASSAKEIRAWVHELEAMESSLEINTALDQALELLDTVEAYENTTS